MSDVKYGDSQAQYCSDSINVLRQQLGNTSGQVTCRGSDLTAMHTAHAR